MEFPIPGLINLELLPLVSGCTGYNKPPSLVREASYLILSDVKQSGFLSADLTYW